jgi:hypothetical protein
MAGVDAAGMEIQVVDKPSISLPPPPAAKPQQPLSYLSTAELAECTCPEPCERDHDRD